MVHKFFSGPKFFLDTKVFRTNNFGTQIFHDPNFFRKLLFWDPFFCSSKFIGTYIFSTPNLYLDPYFFVTKIFLGQNFFWNLNFLQITFRTQIGSGPKYFQDPNSFGTESFLEPKIFWDPKFFGIYIFSCPKLFSGPIFFHGPKVFGT